MQFVDLIAPEAGMVNDCLPSYRDIVTVDQDAKEISMAVSEEKNLKNARQKQPCHHFTASSVLVNTPYRIIPLLMEP